MGKRASRRPGDLVAIPLPSGSFGYGRVLDKLLAVYDKKSDVLESNESIFGSPILFVTAVHASAFSSGRWPVVGFQPLELRFHEPTKFFRPNPSGKGFLIYVSKPAPRAAYEEYEASAEDCVGLEPLLVWDPDQIEQRVDDHFSGKENAHLVHYMKQPTEQLRGSLN